MARRGFRLDESDGEASGLTTWCEIDKDNTADYHHSDNTLDYHPVRRYNLYRQKNVQIQEAVFDPSHDLKVHKFMDKVKKGVVNNFTMHHILGNAGYLVKESRITLVQETQKMCMGATFSKVVMKGLDRSPAR